MQQQTTEYMTENDGYPVDQSTNVMYTVYDSSAAPAYTVAGNNVSNTSQQMMVPPAQGLAPVQYTRNKIFIAVGALLLILVGGVLLGVSNSTLTNCALGCVESSYSSYSYSSYSSYSSSYSDDYKCAKKCLSSYNAMKGSGIALLVIGSILLLGDGAYVYFWEPQQNQMQQEMQMA